MDIITFDDFKKLEIKIGKIVEAERVEGSDKLLKLKVDFGPVETLIPDVNETPTSGIEGDATQDIEARGGRASTEAMVGQGNGRITRQIIAGLGKFYAPEELIGKECPFAYNLAPRMLKGLESQGMILCPSNEDGPVLLNPDKPVPPGSLIK